MESEGVQESGQTLHEDEDAQGESSPGSKYCPQNDASVPFRLWQTDPHDHSP